MGEKGYATNVAAEYYVLSTLYRLGAEAYLTLGNKKAIDIVINKGKKVLTVDVKGIRDSNCWPVDNIKEKGKNHYYVFITYMNNYADPKKMPEAYILPAGDLFKEHSELEGKPLIYQNPKGNRRVVNRHALQKLKKKYMDKWAYLV